MKFLEIKDLKGKLVAVLGYGKEGKAVTAYLLKHGVTPVLFDERPWEEWGKHERDEIKALGVNFIFGPDAFAELKGFDVVFRSPGIRLSSLGVIPSAPEGSLNQQSPTKQNVSDFSSDTLLGMTQKPIITSQTMWFFEHCPAKIIGVTGTKGKGTTSSLIYEIMSLSSRVQPKQSLVGKEIAASPDKALTPRNDSGRIYLTGNIGKVQPLEFLDQLTENDWVVYELSSFQLQDLRHSPHIGVVLMVTSEHLDYHRDVEEYVNAKSAIVKFQTIDDFSIVNQDFENSRYIGMLGQGKKEYFSTQVSADCYADGGAILFKGQEVVKVDELQLRGRHNLQNVCASILAAQAAGVDMEIAKQVITSFKGLEHRLEFVAEKNGVKFYNDSFSTTPETAIAAIQSFTEPEIVILGGSSKNSDFAELSKVISGTENIKALILIGQEAGRIKKLIDTAGGTTAKVLTGAVNMDQIFAQVKSVASSGDIVLLSPACASFDMFKSYVDRGERFKELALNYSNYTN